MRRKERLQFPNWRFLLSVNYIRVTSILTASLPGPRFRWNAANSRVVNLLGYLLLCPFSNPGVRTYLPSFCSPPFSSSLPLSQFVVYAAPIGVPRRDFYGIHPAAAAAAAAVRSHPEGVRPPLAAPCCRHRRRCLLPDSNDPPPPKPENVFRSLVCGI